MERSYGGGGQGYIYYYFFVAFFLQSSREMWRKGRMSFGPWNGQERRERCGRTGTDAMEEAIGWNEQRRSVRHGENEKTTKRKEKKRGKGMTKRTREEDRKEKKDSTSRPSLSALR